MARPPQSRASSSRPAAPSAGPALALAPAAQALAPPRADDDWLREIGRRVFSLRRARGLTQRALARKSRLSESHVYRIEQGANMGVGTLLAVARALGVPPHALFSPDAPSPVDAAVGYPALDGPRPQMRETAVERVSAFVQGLKADERRRAMRLLRAAFPERDRG